MPGKAKIFLKAEKIVANGQQTFELVPSEDVFGPGTKRREEPSFPQERIGVVDELATDCHCRVNQLLLATGSKIPVHFIIVFRVNQARVFREG